MKPEPVATSSHLCEGRQCACSISHASYPPLQAFHCALYSAAWRSNCCCEVREGISYRLSNEAPEVRGANDQRERHQRQTGFDLLKSAGGVGNAPPPTSDVVFRLRFPACPFPRNWPPLRNRAPTLRPQVATGIQGQASQHAFNVGQIRAIPHGFGRTDGLTVFSSQAFRNWPCSAFRDRCSGRAADRGSPRQFLGSLILKTRRLDIFRPDCHGSNFTL